MDLLYEYIIRRFSLTSFSSRQSLDEKTYFISFIYCFSNTFCIYRLDKRNLCIVVRNKKVLVMKPNAYISCRRKWCIFCGFLQKM